MVPLESEFGWSRALISAAIAVNIALFGLIGPFAASVMDRWGLRRVVLARARAAGRVGRAVDADAHRVAARAAVGRARRRRHRRHVDGAGRRRRHALVRRSGAASSWACCRPPTPPASWCSCRCWPRVVETSGWRSAALIVAGGRRGGVRRSCWLFMRDRPADIGLRPYGQAADAPARRRGRRPMAPLAALAMPRARGRSGCSPARSSSAARAPTA